jgi:parvulin-like peptidyl-prolyl isomerase
VRSPVRFVVVAAVAALLATACGGSAGSSAAATVDGEDIPLATVEDIVSRKAEGLGLEGADLRAAEQAIEAGLIQRQALSGALQSSLSQEDPQLTDEALDSTYTAYETGVGADTIAAGREELDLDEDEWRDLFDKVARAEVAALLAGIDPATSLDRTEQVAAAQREVLTLLIQITAIEQVFEERELELEDGAVDELFEQQLDQAGTDEAGFEARLRGSGLTIEDYKSLIMTAFAQQDAITTSFGEVSEEDLRAQYDNGVAAGQFTVGVVSHILISPEGVEPGAEAPPEALAAAEEQANDVVAQLEAGADFAELATEFSADPGSAANGGALPEAPFGNYVAEFRDAALEAPIGEVVGPVETQFGFHIIRVDSREEQSFEDVEPQLRQSANAGGQQQASALLQEKLSTAEIEVASRFGEWDPATGRVVAPGTAGDGQG